MLTGLLILNRRELSSHRYFDEEDKKELASKLLDTKREWATELNRQTKNFQIAVKRILTYNPKGLPDSLEEFLFGDEDVGYKMTEYSFTLSKKHIQKVIYGLFNPLESSYSSIKENFQILFLFRGIPSRDLPELSYKSLEKQFDKIYKVTRQTLGRYNKNRNKFMVEERKFISLRKSKITNEGSKSVSSDNPFSGVVSKKHMSKPILMKTLDYDESKQFELNNKNEISLETEEFESSFEVIDEQPIPRSSLPKSVVTKHVTSKPK